VTETDNEEQSLEEWLEEERQRLKKGFSYEPSPPSTPERPNATDQILAGLGLGAGVAAGTIAGHANPITFEGCSPELIISALESEFATGDTRIEVRRADTASVVTIFQAQADHPGTFSPALSITLIRPEETITIAMSDLSQQAKREALGSMGSTLLRQGRQLLFRRRGVGGLVDSADGLLNTIESISEDIQDLTLPQQVWAVVDHVGGAAEEAYLEAEKRRRRLERKREAAERAWLYCPSCGRAYRPDEAERVNCPSCGGDRGPKPDWLK